MAVASGQGPPPEQGERGEDGRGRRALETEVGRWQGESDERTEQHACLAVDVEDGERVDRPFTTLGGQAGADGGVEQAPAKPVAAEAMIRAGRESTQPSSPKPTVRSRQPAQADGHVK